MRYSKLHRAQICKRANKLRTRSYSPTTETLLRLRIGRNAMQVGLVFATLLCVSIKRQRLLSGLSQRFKARPQPGLLGILESGFVTGTGYRTFDLGRVNIVDSAITTP